MIAPVATARPQAFKLESTSTSNAKSKLENSAHPQRSELAVAVNKVLHKKEDNLDNRQKLNQLSTLLTNASSDEINELVEALPNSDLKQWIKEIQNNTLPNNGLTADQRQEFFSLLARQLTPAQADRWQSVMPESLQQEFSSALKKHNNTDQNSFGLTTTTSGYKQDSLFLLGNSLNAQSQQQFLSPDKAFRPLQHSKSAPALMPAPTPVSAEKQAFIDTINTIAPNATDASKQQLIDSYAKVKAQMAAVGKPGNDSQNLVKAIQETTNLFRAQGLGSLLPTNGDGWVSYKYNSDNLPSELTHLQSRGTSDGRKFGERQWHKYVSLSSFTDSLLLKTAEQQLAKPLAMAEEIRNKQFDSERGFAPEQTIDNAVIDLEQTVFAKDTTDTPALFAKMQALNAQVKSLDSSGFIKTTDGTTHISAQLLRHFGDDYESRNNQGWINTANLNNEQLLAAADQLRIDVLSTQLDETGTSDLDTATRGIKALNAAGSEQQNQKLVNQYLKLQRSIQLASKNPEIESNLSQVLIETNNLFRDAGLPTVLPAPNKRGHVRIRYDSDSLPSELSSLKDTVVNDREFGQYDWHVYKSPGDLPTNLQVKYAKSQLASIASEAATSSLSQINQFAGHTVTHSEDIQAMMDSAKPIATGTSTTGAPVLGELLQTFDSQSSTAASEHDFRQLEGTSYRVASSLITDSANHMSQEQMQMLHTWVNAESMGQLGYRDREVVVNHRDEEKPVSLGPFGNFGESKFRFSKAWLGSSQEERLDYLGIDKNRWIQAEPYLTTATNADGQARDIKREAFDEFDAVKLFIAGRHGFFNNGILS